MTIDGLLTWRDGNMSGDGQTVANGGIAFNVTGFPTLQGHRVVDNDGTATWTGGGSIIFSGGGTFNNNGTFDARTDQQMGANGGGSPVFNNIGTFRKSVGAVNMATTVGWLFNNLNTNTDGMSPGGIVNVQNGTLIFSGGGTSQGSDAVGSASTTGAVNRPLTLRAAATSRTNRARNPGSPATSSRMTFTATSRSITLCSAR